MSLIDIFLITFSCLLFITVIIVFMFRFKKVADAGQTYSKEYEKTYYIIGIILLISLAILIAFAFLKRFNVPLIHKSLKVIKKIKVN